ncbi:MAG: transcriptional activator NhaR [Gammaproteobacteria bacterium]
MRTLNFKHLYYFWVVAKESSIARASELLHLTPQTISEQLRLFEETTGAQLFTRTGRRLVLTEVGHLALNYANEIFQLGGELTELLRNRPTGQPLRFSVGIADVVPKLVAYRLLEPALRAGEPIYLICREGKFDALLADMAVHRLDVVLADSPVIPSFKVKLYNHPLGECGTTFFATRERSAYYRERFPPCLNGAPILLPNRESAIRGQLDQWLDEQQLRPVIVGEFQDSALLMTFGQAGMGVFSAPSAIESEVETQFDVAAIGRVGSIRQQFFAISAERKMRHPAVVAISNAARGVLTRNARDKRKNVDLGQTDALSR